VIAVRDLTGALRAWIDVGGPTPRLHKAGRRRRGSRLHAQGSRAPGPPVVAGADPPAEALELYSIDRTLRGELTARLQRRMSWLSPGGGRLTLPSAMM